jgi:hypothetical protein
MKEPEWLYHYTDEAGYDAIRNSGSLVMSRRPDGGQISLGDGVYFTRLPPSTPERQLMLNNYNTADHPLGRARIRYYFQVPYAAALSGRSVTAVGGTPTTRDVVCVRWHGGSDRMHLPVGTWFGKTAEFPRTAGCVVA